MAGFEGVAVAPKSCIVAINDIHNVETGTHAEIAGKKPLFSVTNQYAIGGCFEGIRFYVKDGKAVFLNLNDNLERFCSSMAFQLITPPSVEDLQSIIRKLFFANQDFLKQMEKDGSWGYLRPWSEDLAQSLGVTECHNPGVMMMFMSFSKYLGEPLHGYICHDLIRAVTSNKTGCKKLMSNYLISMLAGDWAKKTNTKGGAATALMLSDTEPRILTEWETSNFMMVTENDEWISPRLDDVNILPGITKMTIFELLRKKGIRVINKDIAYQELLDCNPKALVSMGTAAKLNRFSSLTDSLSGKEFNFDLNDRVNTILAEVRDEFDGIFSGKTEGFEKSLFEISYL